MEINEFLAQGSKLFVRNSLGRGRGLVLNTPVLKHSLLSSSTPLVAFPNIKTKLRLDRHCNHCFQSNKLPLCQPCQEIPELYAELKEDHKDILEIKEYYAATAADGQNGAMEYTPMEGLLHKLALRICHESRQGFQNTTYFLETLIAPVAPPEAAAALQDDFEFLTAFLTNLGYEEEIGSFLTLEWYVRTLGVLYLNTMSTSQGSALYDLFSLLNHSCEPNVTIEFQGLIASLRAKDDLAEGEELFVDYTALREEYQQHLHVSPEQGKASQSQERVEKELSKHSGSDVARKNSFLKDLYGFDCRENCSCTVR
jgi:hypothetical protein